MSQIDWANIHTKDQYDENALNAVTSKAHAGNTILFLGAGFAYGAINEGNGRVPRANALSREICKLGKFEEDEDLAYSADFFLKHRDPADLLRLLRTSFTITDTTSTHRIIASIDWRRVYTTNYDNCYEMAAAQTNRPVKSLTLADSPAKYFRSKDVCVHINGSIDRLDHEALDTSFKLSDSSYTSSDAFSDSSWAYRFRKDLEVCSQIVFVGYSLYDMEIKRLLVSSPNMKEKTFFVTKPQITRKAHHRLSAFGHVFPVGVEPFAEMLESDRPADIPFNADYFSALEPLSLSLDVEYADEDKRDFLIRGKSRLDFIASSLTSARSPYAVARAQLDEALAILASGNALVIHSSMANGKSVFAHQLKAHLALQGQRVYGIDDSEADYEHDIEKLASLDTTIYLCLDDFEQHLDVATYFAKTLGKNGKLILTERPHRYRRAVKKLGVQTHNINVDYLHDREIEQIDEIFRNTGLWGSRAAESTNMRLDYLRKDCESQLVVILLNVLKSPSIISRFESAFLEILRHPETKKTVHAICLMQHMLPAVCSKSFIADLADSDYVYTNECENRLVESGLFEFRGNKLVTRSSLFGTFILSNLYKASYSIDQMIRIVERFNRNRHTLSFEEEEIYRSMMRFGTIAAVLPEKGRPKSYIEFYEKLKREVPGVIRNPHFWLQYAMAVMSDDNKLDDAERLLETAYARAGGTNYDTTYIDNQAARLNLKKALQQDDPGVAFESFAKAHRILRLEESDIYKFRQAGLYIPFYEQRYSDLSKKHKVAFEHAMKEMEQQYRDFVDREYAFTGVPSYQSAALAAFVQVVHKIQSDRGG